MATRSLYQLLLEALHDSRPGMAPDDLSDIARRYPNGGAREGSNTEPQTRFPPPVNVPPRDVRRLSQAPFVERVQGKIEGSQTPDAQLGASSSPSKGDSNDSFFSFAADAPYPSYTGTSAPQCVPNPFGISLPLGFRRSLLQRSFGPICLPPMPRPHRPEWLDPLAEILQGYSRVAPAFGEGDRDCKEEIREAREICTDADAADWKGDYGTGPYKNPRGKLWDIEDCVRGRVSERCGGNRYDRPDGKPKKKKYL